MRSLVEHLISIGAKPHQYPLRAERIVAARFQMFPPPMLPGPYDKIFARSKDDLFVRMDQWFNDHYGDRLKVDWSLGSFVLMQRGEPWRCLIPSFWGTVRFYIDPQRMRDAENSGNVLDFIDGFSQRRALGLDATEISEIGRQFETGLAAIILMDDLPNNLLCNQGRADFKSSVDVLLSVNHPLGKAKRETALCFEKVCKGLLEYGKAEWKANHKLSALVDSIEVRWRLKTDPALLSVVSTEASVSYDKHVTLTEAHAAHVALLSIFASWCAQREEMRKKTRRPEAMSAVAHDGTRSPH